MSRKASEGPFSSCDENLDKNLDSIDLRVCVPPIPGAITNANPTHPFATNNYV